VDFDFEGFGCVRCADMFVDNVGGARMVADYEVLGPPYVIFEIAWCWWQRGARVTLACIHNLLYRRLIYPRRSVPSLLQYRWLHANLATWLSSGGRVHFGRSDIDITVRRSVLSTRVQITPCLASILSIFDSALYGEVSHGACGSVWLV
jgi:hypothetical protein